MHSSDAADRFQNPLTERYASAEMSRLFSARTRHGTWRDLWIALAEAQGELGLPISKAQVAGLRARRDEFDWERVAELERELRHDVMAHVHHYGELVPEAKAILHLGATSCYVTDNADLVIYRSALRLVAARLRRAIAPLAEFANTHRALPCLGYTHFQVAQPVTVGKRASLWLHDLLLDLDEVERVAAWLPFRGVKGTTGTQASFLALFDGDRDRVEELDRQVARAFDFERRLPVCGQTYTRKLDWTVHAALSGVAQSAAKFANDVRLLSHEGELGEPRETRQIGSSAMPYKRNPMRSERIGSLARYVLAAADTSAQTAASQWLERTLDDSAVRRIAIPESFLAVDAILLLVENVARGLQVYPKVIERKLAESLPFLAAEEILMAGVRAGGDRQHLHERIRVHSMAAVAAIQEEGAANTLLERIAADEAFAPLRDRLPELVAAERFVGCAAAQVEAFLVEQVEPRLRASADTAELSAEIKV